MDERTLIELDPQQLRVRIAVEVGFELDVQKAELSLALTDGSGRQENRAFRLELLARTRETRPGGFFHSDYAVVAYELRLDTQSIEDLRSLQWAIAPIKNSNLSFNVTSSMASTPANFESIRFWIDLKLKQSESYFVLLDGADIKAKKED